MASRLVVGAFVRRLESDIASLVADREHVALAYSGGLASTLIAMIARKRCDLVCYVSGTPDSADVRAARAAKQHMDYRIEIVLLDRADTRRLQDRMEVESPAVSLRAIRTLLPLAAVMERWPDHLWLNGFGSPRANREVAAEVRRLGSRTPLAELRSGDVISRATLRATAISLGLSEEWAGTPHRTPAEGSGITSFLTPTRPSK